jgi:hypothetical protein
LSNEETNSTDQTPWKWEWEWEFSTFLWNQKANTALKEPVKPSRHSCFTLFLYRWGGSCIANSALWHVIKNYEIKVPPFLVLTQIGGKWSYSHHCFTTGVAVPGTHWIVDWVNAQLTLTLLTTVFTPVGNWTSAVQQTAYSNRALLPTCIYSPF